MKNQASVAQLNDILTENFNLHRNNSRTLADFMIAMWLARTVNLSQMANYSTRSGSKCVGAQEMSKSLSCSKNSFTNIKPTVNMQQL